MANAIDRSKDIDFDVLIDTGAGGLILPKIWQKRLGEFAETREVELEMADSRIVRGIVAGPVRIMIEGFDPVYNELTFIDMEPHEGKYEPLLGYIILEQSRAAVDMLGHRLIKVKYLDLK